jgi:hypothetical protein
MKRAPLLLALAALTACADIPKDPDGTLERVRAERRFRVGLIEGSRTQPDRQALFLSRVARASSAQPEMERGAAEPLLARLAEGELDLVVGELAPTSPWKKHVTLLPPLHERVNQDDHVHLVAAAPNGENAWIALLTREARAVAGTP